MVLEFSASVPALYGGLPVPPACAAAAADGFRCVELWEAPPRHEWADVVHALTTYDLSLTSVNSYAGPSPSFGVAADPTALATWREEFVDTLDFARLSGATAVNVLAGARMVGQTRVAQQACLQANLEWALERLADDDITLLLEPLNAADRHSPLLRCVNDAVAVIEEVGSDRVRLLFDAYHLHQEEPDLFVAFDRALPHVGHVQIADFPGRGEPGTGELPWRSFLAHVSRSGYRGRIGCEFAPTHRGAVAAARVALAASLVDETAEVS